MYANKHHLCRLFQLPMILFLDYYIYLDTYLSYL